MRFIKVSSMKMAWMVFGVVLVCLAVVGTAVGGTIYVDASASGNNDGSSWADAYNYLQDALADADSLGVPVEIWVAAGNYKPDVNSAVPGGSGDQTATFQLINGVAIYGGFAGGEASLDERDWETYETVLSGDLYGDDDLVIEPGTGGGSPGENCAEAGPINRGATAFSTFGSTTDGPGDCPTYHDIWYVYTAEYTGYYRVSVAQSGSYSASFSVYEGATCPPTVLLACEPRDALLTVTEDTDYLIRVGGKWSGSTGTGTITVTRDVLADNSYHVVTGSGTEPNAVLDGFTITGGNSAGSGTKQYGGGMYNYAGSPTVANCTFSGNAAREGGGMYNRESSNPTVSNCMFSENSANYGGGGMYNIGGSSPTVTDCTFSGNSARRSGGGMNGGDGAIMNCTFIGNSAVNDGGGMYGVGGAITNCTFSANSAGATGGGMTNHQSSVMVTNCSFSGNSANWEGGGMQNQQWISPTVTNCTFIGNSANEGGGMKNHWQSSPTVTNCIFSGNSANYGGGMYNKESSSPTVTNCTFSGNSAAADKGGGIYNHDTTGNPIGIPVFRNCILWGNEAAGGLIEEKQIWSYRSSPQVDFTCVEGLTGLLGGVDNIGDDPLFADADGADDTVGTEDDNLRLSADSACIDAGINVLVPPDTPDLDNDGDTTEPIPLDLDGRTRFVDGDYNGTDIVDMGAYEYGSTGIIEVEVDMDEFWMYQSLPGQSNSNLIADVLITDDPMANSSYTYDWEFILPDDVTIAPTITAGGGPADPCCTFAAPSCNSTGGISDSGQTFTIRVTVTGADFGNTGIAEAEFGIALLGDANNDGVVNVADRSIINAFWRLGAAGPFTFNDCNVNDDGAVNVADRSIANAVWRGVLGQNSVTTPCPFR